MLTCYYGSYYHSCCTITIGSPSTLLIYCHMYMLNLGSNLVSNVKLKVPVLEAAIPEAVSNLVYVTIKHT